MSRVGVVIPAGGAGQRMGGTAKAFVPLRGRPLLQHALEPFLERTDVTAVVVALPADAAAAPPEWLVADARVKVVAGGAERGDSVRAGLEHLPATVEVVLVHDAARPLVTPLIIDRCIDAAAHGRCAIAAIPVVDTIKEVDDGGRILSTPDRRALRAAQTPQAFPAAVLRAAYARAAAEGVAATDDAALVARYGAVVTVVDGAPDNIKVTTPADLVMADALLAQRSRPR